MAKIVEYVRKAVYPDYGSIAREVGAEPLDGMCRKFIFWHDISGSTGKPRLAKALLQAPADDRHRLISLARRFDRQALTYERENEYSYSLGKRHWETATCWSTEAFLKCMAAVSNPVREQLVPLFVESPSGLCYFSRIANSGIIVALQNHSDERILHILEVAQRFVTTSIALGWQLNFSFGIAARSRVPNSSEGANTLHAFLELAKLPVEADLRRHADQTLAFLQQEGRRPDRKYAQAAAQALNPQVIIARGANVDSQGNWPNGPLTREIPVQPRRRREPDADMRRLLADAQNVHRGGRVPATELSRQALAQALAFDCNHGPHVVDNLRSVESLLNSLLELGPQQTPSWMWHPRAGRSSELGNALHALKGAASPNDFTGPINTNLPMARLLALAWQAIEQYPSQPHHEPNCADAQATMRNALVKALATCMEEDHGVIQRVCNVGISQRLLSVLQGYYPQVSLDNFAVSPQELVTTLTSSFVTEHGDCVTKKILEAFRKHSFATAAAQFSADPNAMQVFREHLDAYISQDIEVAPDLTPAAHAQKLMADFEVASGGAPSSTDLLQFRRLAQDSVSQQWPPRSPEWRQAIALIAAYCGSRKECI